jgi:uncharacterized protein
VKIDLSKIEREPLSFVEDLHLDSQRFDADRVSEAMAVRLEGEIRSVGERFAVSGEARAHGRISCGRCLKPVAWDSTSSFSMEVAMVEAAPLDAEVALDDGDLDVVFLEEPCLDLEELAVEQIMLELPIRVLCTEDCAGLCPSCGADLNEGGACGCEPDTDPRWEALAGVEGRPSDDN